MPIYKIYKEGHIYVINFMKLLSGYDQFVATDL